MLDRRPYVVLFLVASIIALILLSVAISDAKTGIKYNNDIKYFIYERSILSYEKLENITMNVLDSLPHVENRKELVDLIVETIITETNGGLYFDVTGNGGLGVAQINLNTAKYILKSMKEKEPQVYKSIQLLKNNKMTLKENLIHNISYGIALCATYYWMSKGDDLYKYAATLKQRSKLWKIVYNTKAGTGTPLLYRKKVTSFKRRETHGSNRD